MSPQPAETAPVQRHVRIPRTVAGVRDALPADLRAQFQAEMDATAIPEISGLVADWWQRAVILASPGALAQINRLRAAAAQAPHPAHPAHPAHPRADRMNAGTLQHRRALGGTAPAPAADDVTDS